MPLRTVRHAFTAVAMAGVALVAAADTLTAQAWVYPSFQPPYVIGREYHGLVADSDDYGTSLVFQWREGVSPRAQFSLDVGLADPDFGDARFLLGGGYAYQLNRAAANPDLPLDLLFTVGAYGNFGDGTTILRIPVGVSVGHRFPLDAGQMAITPYVHPRAALYFCNGDRCGADDSDTDIRINFDLGADFELTRALSLRFSVMLGGDEEEAFGFGLAWRPRGLTPIR